MVIRGGAQGCSRLIREMQSRHPPVRALCHLCVPYASRLGPEGGWAAESRAQAASAQESFEIETAQGDWSLLLDATPLVEAKTVWDNSVFHVPFVYSCTYTANAYAEEFQ